MSAALVSMLISLVPLAHFGVDLWMLGYREHDAYSYAMQYNKIGWSFLCLAFLLHIFPRKRAAMTRAEPEYVIGGLLFGCMIFMKANFAFTGASVVVIGAILRKQWGHLFYTFGITAIAIVVASCFGFSYLDFINAYLRNFNETSGYVGGHAVYLTKIRDVVGEVRTSFPYVTLVLIVLFQSLLLNNRTRKEFWLSRLGFDDRIWTGIIGLPIGIGVAALNAGDARIFLIFLAIVCSDPGESLRSDGPVDRSALRKRHRLLIQALVAVVCLTLVGNIFLHIHSAYHNKMALRKGTEQAFLVNTKRLQDMYFLDSRKNIDPKSFDVAEIWGKWLEGRNIHLVISDAINIMRGHIKPETRIFPFTPLDVVSFPLGLPRPLHAPTWTVDSGVANGDDSPKYDPNVILAHANTVLVPNVPLNAPPLSLWGEWKKLLAYVENHFQLTAKSDLWVLYLRKENPKTGE
ncbi:MAG: hypothetical protein HQL63_01920 [Magnetococcales bacterium]|nr:hypothetical protein [Magnetococcales bacterium]